MSGGGWSVRYLKGFSRDAITTSRLKAPPTAGSPQKISESYAQIETHHLQPEPCVQYPPRPAPPAVPQAIAPCRPVRALPDEIIFAAFHAAIEGAIRRRVQGGLGRQAEITS